MGQLLQRPQLSSGGAGVSPIPGVFQNAAGINGFPNNAFTKVLFDTVITDGGGYHLGSTFNGITIPVAGFYQVNFTISFNAAAATTVVAGGLGAAAISNIGAFVQVSNNLASGCTVSGSALVSLALGQNLSVFGFQNSGGGMNGVLANLSLYRVS